MDPWWFFLTFVTQTLVSIINTHKMAEVQLENATRQREASLKLPSIHKTYENWPLKNPPEQILALYPNHLRIFISPPELEYDKFRHLSDPKDHYFPKIEDRLSSYLLSLCKHYPCNDKLRPTLLVDKAWESKRFGGRSAIIALAECLESEPFIVLESTISHGKLNLQVAYKGMGQKEFFYEEAIPYFEYHNDISLAAARARIEKTASSDKQKIQVTPKDITIEDEEILFKVLGVIHCIVTSWLADVHHLIYHNAPPLLPQLLPDLIKELPDFLLNDTNPVFIPLIQGVVKGYQAVFQKLEETEQRYQVPGLLLNLAQGIASLHLEDKAWAKELVAKSEHCYLQLQGVTLTERNDFLSLIKPRLSSEDRKYFKELKSCLSLLGEHDMAHQVEQTTGLLELKTDILTLQTEVIDLLKEVGTLMQDAKEKFACAPLNDEESSKEYEGYCSQISAEIDKVEKLELVMAVVAPMSAGKSTIINAIVGQDLLPSRNTATTTLPTRICLKQGLAEPVLTLSLNTLNLFQMTEKQLKKTIKKDGLEKIKKEKLQSYPHLWELVHKIVEGKDSLMKENISGRGEIRRMLTDLNDMIRLCILITDFNPLANISEFPQIETSFPEFLEAQLKIPSNLIGNLVIVDTPGPSESMQHDVLLNVVREQLKISSIVVFVLDFTQLKTEAAEDVKKEVREVIDNLRGKDNLYVLVNKIDERIKDKSSMSEERVREFVKGELEVTETGHLFEIAARSAFRASDFWYNLKQQSPLNMSSLLDVDSVIRLFEEAYGAMAEDELEELKTEGDDRKEKRIKSVADRLWKKSGFQSFLEKAVITLMEDVAPRSMNSGFLYCSNILIKLQNSLSLKNAALIAEIETLEKQIKELASDLNELGSEKAKSVERIPEILTEFRKEVENYFQRVNANARIARIKELGDEIGSFRRFIDWILRNEEKQFEFDNEAEAKEFANGKTLTLLKEVENFLDGAYKNILKTLDNKYNKLRQQIERIPRDILSKASERLGKALDVKLKPPEVQLPEFQTTSYFKSFSGVSTKSKQTVAGYRPKKYSLFGLYEYIGKEAIMKTETKYVVKQQELHERIDELLLKAIKDTKEQVAEALELEFHDQFKKYFNEASSYLTSYQRDLQHEKDNRGRDSGLGKLIREILDELQGNASKLIDKVENCRVQNFHFLNKRP